MQTLLQMTQSDCSDLASRNSTPESKSFIPRKAAASSPSPTHAEMKAATLASRRAAAAPSPSPSTLTTLSPSSSPETSDTFAVDRHGQLNMSDIYASFSEVGDGEGEEGGGEGDGEGAKVVSNSFSLDLIYAANGNDPEALDISDVNIMKTVSKPASPAKPSPSKAAAASPSFSFASSLPRQQQQQQQQGSDDSADLDDPFPDLPPPQLPPNNSGSGSDDLDFPEVGKPRKLSLGAGGIKSTAPGTAAARRATIASNFDRMSNDIATKFAGVKVVAQHPAKKYKTYMPYMGSIASAVGLKKDGGVTSTSASTAATSGSKKK